MGRIIATCLLLSSLSACTLVAAVGGAAVDGAMYMFTSEKKSMPFAMRTVLIAVQKTLDNMDLSATLIESVDDGYILQFTNNKLSGSLYLGKETDSLTTISGRTYKGMNRAKSIEQAIFEGIQSRTPHVQQSERLNIKAYNYIRQEPTTRSAKIGWFIPGSKLDVSPSDQAGWLEIKLPSGKKGFLKGNIVK